VLPDKLEPRRRRVKAASGKQEEDSEDEKAHECKEGSAMLRRALSIILGLGISSLPMRS